MKKIIVFLFAIFLSTTSSLFSQQQPRQPALPGRPQPAPQRPPQQQPQQQQRPQQPQPQQQRPVQPQQPAPRPQPVTPVPQPVPQKPGQNPTNTQTNPPPTGPEPEEPGAFPRRSDKFRVRALFGAGYGSVLPAILSETGRSWQTNSFVRSGQDGTSQAALIFDQPNRVPEVSYNFGVDISYRDRLTLSLEKYQINRRYDQSDATKVSFLEPGNATYANAAFEGLRLFRYKENRTNIDLLYLHPISNRGLKLGAFVGRESYVENIEVSMGSLNLVRSTNILNWSEAGKIPGEYRESGTVFGPAARFQLFEWLSFNYRMTLLRRSGNFAMSGFQVLNAGPNGTNIAQSTYLLAPVHAASLEDRGVRHVFETVFRIYCRYSVHVGILKEDYQRSYSSYLGNTFSTGGDFSAKTPGGIGIGEMTNKHDYHKFEVYLRFGVHFFF